MKNIFALIFVCCIAPFISHAQSYRTQEGTIAAILPYSDTTEFAESRELIVTLNYENGEIYFKVPVQSFRTGDPAVDSFFINTKDQWAEFKGSLGIPYINTKKHPAQELPIEGDFTLFTQTYFIKAKGTLTHAPAGYFSCILNMRMELPATVLNISRLNKNKMIQLVIQQAVLKRITE